MVFIANNLVVLQPVQNKIQEAPQEPPTPVSNYVEEKHGELVKKYNKKSKYLSDMAGLEKN